MPYRCSRTGWGSGEQVGADGLGERERDVRYLDRVDQQDTEISQRVVIRAGEAAGGGASARFHHRRYSEIDACGNTGSVPPNVQVTRPKCGRHIDPLPAMWMPADADA